MVGLGHRISRSALYLAGGRKKIWTYFDISNDVDLTQVPNNSVKERGDGLDLLGHDYGLFVANFVTPVSYPLVHGFKPVRLRMRCKIVHRNRAASPRVG